MAHFTCIIESVHLLQVGFNNGDGVNYYMHPLSLTPNVLYIYTQSNVGVKGRWIYRVDGSTCITCPPGTR